MAVPQAKEELGHFVYSPLRHLHPIPFAATGRSFFLRGARIPLSTEFYRVHMSGFLNDVVMEALNKKACESMCAFVMSRRKKWKLGEDPWIRGLPQLSPYHT